MSKNNKRIIICGGGGSGKDLLKQRFIDKGYIPSVSYTTRPIRDGEVDGEDYFFVTERTFQKLIGEGVFQEYKIFRDWFYGTHISDFTLADIFIMTPSAIEELPKDIRDSSIVFYIDIDESIRGKRLMDRNDVDSVKRRLQADREMFEYFCDYDVRINSPTF
jgi:guanylate kinase